MSSPASSSKTDRLRMLTRPLRPARAPFYVQHATRHEFPMVGWWWHPADSPSPVPLGASYEMALMNLTHLLEGAPA